ncbi:PIN domain-containing protein [uncultured Treponema sp.]|uniref:PIN domain-containing protein n=1 Tax=uncultured Treponema sp. TaxID=162155 RepID=UPI0035A71300
MELLIDTNIVLDIVQQREPWFSSSYSVFKSCIQKKHNGYVSAHSISDLFFILRKPVMYRLEKTL